MPKDNDFFFKNSPFKFQFIDVRTNKSYKNNALLFLILNN
ncbi:hypothetical protein CG09_0685 [Riemerella anatipestifer]|nr:hypothetical protein G148_0977 [Riemerella anatipestifer RA-CH-2]AKP70921.1 hypothetical protein CG09_0685 [Riemerella anatipestifer]